MGPGVGTPGFWKHWTSIWDGNTSNDSGFSGKANFPIGDILYTVTNPATGTNTTPGILIGDWNHDGVTDNGEHTLFLSVTDALNILNYGGSNGAQQLERMLVTSWLNVMEGNSFNASGSTPNTATGNVQTDINDAITWLQNNPSTVSTSSPTWGTPSYGSDPTVADSGHYYGQAIMNALSYYNSYTLAGLDTSRDGTANGTGSVVGLVGVEAYQTNFFHH